MAYMLCDIHGGNTASLVSPAIQEFILNNSNVIGLKEIKSIDEYGNIYTYYVDSDFYTNIKTSFQIDLDSQIKSENTMFEISLELVAVCPKCLRNWLNTLKPS